MQGGLNYSHVKIALTKFLDMLNWKIILLSKKI
jgi:cystathionine beta-lyase family protein involved in aluminum resistance